MEEIDPQFLAQQLRKPEGEFGQKLAEELNKTNKHLTYFTYDSIDLKDGDKVLEIGFGNGKLVPSLLNRNNTISIFGIDFSKEMVQEAITYNEKHIQEGKMEFHVSGVSNIPYPDNYFDHICTINTLYFWPNPSSDVKEIIRVLKPGGTLHIGIRVKEEVQNMPFIQFGFQLYSTQEGCDLLKNGGFTTTYFNTKLDPEFEFQGQIHQIHSLVISGVK